MILSMERIREVLDNSPLLLPDDWQDLHVAAMQDPTEGAEWLPYYKLNSTLNIMALGVAQGALARAIELLGPNDDITLRMRGAYQHASELYLLSLMPAGIGPNTDPESINNSKAAVERERATLAAQLEKLKGIKS